VTPRACYRARCLGGVTIPSHAKAWSGPTASQNRAETHETEFTVVAVEGTVCRFHSCDYVTGCITIQESETPVVSPGEWSPE
jgi:hypothetical protein